MLNNIFHLVYISIASETLAYSDLKHILESSEKHNAINEITGLLIYQDVYFIQLLEGNETKVVETMSRIIKDRRHNHLQVILESKSNQRIFSDWSMAFCDADTANEGIRKIVEEIITTAQSGKEIEKDRVLPLFKRLRSAKPDVKRS